MSYLRRTMKIKILKDIPNVFVKGVELEAKKLNNIKYKNQGKDQLLVNGFFIGFYGD